MLAPSRRDPPVTAGSSLTGASKSSSVSTPVLGPGERLAPAEVKRELSTLATRLGAPKSRIEPEGRDKKLDILKGDLEQVRSETKFLRDVGQKPVITQLTSAELATRTRVLDEAPTVITTMETQVAQRSREVDSGHAPKLDALRAICDKDQISVNSEKLLESKDSGTKVNLSQFSTANLVKFLNESLKAGSTLATLQPTILSALTSKLSDCSQSDLSKMYVEFTRKDSPALSEIKSAILDTLSEKLSGALPLNTSANLSTGELKNLNDALTKNAPLDDKHKHFASRVSTAVLAA